MSKQKFIDHSKVIFDQSTSKEYDYIVKRRLDNERQTSADGQGRRNTSREFRQIRGGGGQSEGNLARLAEQKKQTNERLNQNQT